MRPTSRAIAACASAWRFRSGKLRAPSGSEAHTLGRIILLILIAFAIYWLFRAFLRSQARDDDAPRPPAAQSPKGEDMVTCTRCGVNLPRSDSREEEGRLVCANNPGCRHPA